MVTVTLYSINMLVFVKSNVLNTGLIMPFLVGSVSGYLFGYFYGYRKQKQLALFDIIEQQKILNEILILSNQGVELQSILETSIQLIIKAPFCKLQSKGGIFVKDPQDTFILKSHHNFSPQLLNLCGKNGVKMGECLCGQAAEKGETIFKTCVDHDHTITFDKMAGHGHYNVPILYNKEVLGVIVVYLDENHAYNTIEVEFLESIANVLSIILNKQKTENKIKKSEATLKEMQDFASIGTWSLDIASGVITASDEVYVIMGYKPQSFSYTEKDFLETIIIEDKGKAEGTLQKAKKGEPFELELRHSHRDGSIVYIINRCIPKRLENGYVSELNGAIIDITRLRTNEKKLNENQELVNGILSATPDPLFLIDLELNEITYYNKAMEDAMNEDPAFIMNYPQRGAAIFRDHVHPDDLEVYDQMDGALRSSDDVFTLKFRTNVFNGEYHWVDQKVMVYHRRANGRVHQVLVVSKDISQVVKAENNIKKLNEELQVQFDDLTKVNQELDQFVYSVSHDLRAPLASMLGLVNLCESNPDQDLLRECMDRMGSSIEKLDSFIKDILNYSRNARTEIDSEEFSIQELVNELIGNIKLLGNPDIKLNLTATEKTVYIGDRRRMSIILNNLLSNACKYADLSKESRFVNISINTDEEGCALTIADNGMGIHASRLGRIFDMFYRGTEESEGSGLGLYIVKETVQKLMGTIEIDSVEGEGTKFYLKLPHVTLLDSITQKA